MATFNVTNTNPSGTGSFQAAIQSANVNSGPDIIDIDPSLAGAVFLDVPDIVGDVTILNGANPVTLAPPIGFALNLFDGALTLPDFSVIRGTLAVIGSSTLSDTTIQADVLWFYFGSNLTWGGVLTGASELLVASSSFGVTLTAAQTHTGATRIFGRLSLEGTASLTSSAYVEVWTNGTLDISAAPDQTIHGCTVPAR